ncbi:MAG: hypothetical protein M3494_13000 [Actinomycetota bacterium]|nr:hypothetical protein [Actinomycetota bacterium]
MDPVAAETTLDPAVETALNPQPLPPAPPPEIPDPTLTDPALAEPAVVEGQEFNDGSI